MKKFILLGLSLCFLVGCSTFKESEFMNHRAMYKNWDHAKFSIENSFGTKGYYVVNPDDYEKSKSQGWWGFNVTPKEKAKVAKSTGNYK